MFLSSLWRNFHSNGDVSTNNGSYVLRSRILSNEESLIVYQTYFVTKHLSLRPHDIHICCLQFGGETVTAFLKKLGLLGLDSNTRPYTFEAYGKTNFTTYMLNNYGTCKKLRLCIKRLFILNVNEGIWTYGNICHLIQTFVQSKPCW